MGSLLFKKSGFAMNMSEWVFSQKNTLLVPKSCTLLEICAVFLLVFGGQKKQECAHFGFPSFYFDIFRDPFFLSIFLYKMGLKGEGGRSWGRVYGGE